MKKLFKSRIMLMIPMIFVCVFYSQLAFSQYRDSWQQPDKIIENIGLKKGMSVGEIGAGDGYFTLKMAPVVGKTGKIFANDISRSSLNKLEKKAKDNNFSNIQTLIGEEADPKFPVNNLDMIIMVYVFHDLTKPVEFTKNVKKYLKPGGTFVIVGRDPDKYPDYRHHFMKKKELLEKMSKTGFKLVRVETFLARDNIYIFQ